MVNRRNRPPHTYTNPSSNQAAAAAITTRAAARSILAAVALTASYLPVRRMVQDGRARALRG
jgi:hypothetical protein